MRWKQLKVFKARRTCFNCRFYHSCYARKQLTHTRRLCGLWEAK